MNKVQKHSAQENEDIPSVAETFGLFNKLVTGIFKLVTITCRSLSPSRTQHYTTGSGHIVFVSMAMAKQMLVDDRFLAHPYQR